MNKEIKEILEKMKDRNETYQFCQQHKLAINDWVYEAHYLLDYITNLQQEIDKLTAESTEWESKCYDLQQENERLKERIAYLERSNDRREDTILGLRQEIIDAEDVIDKAIEIIKEAGCYDETTKEFCDDIWEELPTLLNILQNGSDSQC